MSVPTEKIPVLEKVTGPATIRYGKVPKIHLPGSGGQLQREFNTHLGQALVGKCLHHTGKGRHRRFFVSPTERKTHI